MNLTGLKLKGFGLKPVGAHTDLQTNNTKNLEGKSYGRRPLGERKRKAPKAQKIFANMGPEKRAENIDTNQAKGI
jgi:hypothetical protein